MTGGDEGKWWRREVVTMGSGDEGKWWRREVMMKGSGEEGKWWGGEAVTMGSGEEGKWWRREVMMKGSGDEGKWWGREVVRKGSGDEGKWWGREVVRKGSGEDGKWWGREVVKKGSDDEGEWWGRQVGTMGGGKEGKWWGREVDDGMWWRWEVVRKGSGDEARWWRWEVVRKGSGDEGKWWVGEEAGARNLVFFCVKWLQPAMKGTSSVRRLRLRSVCRFFLPQCNGGLKLLWVCFCVRSCRVFWNLWLQIPLEWLHDVARALFWGGSRSTKPCVFLWQVAAGDDERYLVCATVAVAVGLSFFLPQCNGGLKLLWVCFCVRSYRVFWNLWLQIALEWLHGSCRLLFWSCSVRR